MLVYGHGRRGSRKCSSVRANVEHLYTKYSVRIPFWGMCLFLRLNVAPDDIRRRDWRWNKVGTIQVTVERQQVGHPMVACLFPSCSLTAQGHNRFTVLPVVSTVVRDETGQGIVRVWSLENSKHNRCIWHRRRSGNNDNAQAKSDVLMDA